MPIPGDNGNPRLEREKQNVRIRDVALAGADCQKDINHINPMAPEVPIHLDGAIYKRWKNMNILKIVCAVEILSLLNPFHLVNLLFL